MARRAAADRNAFRIQGAILSRLEARKLPNAGVPRDPGRVADEEVSTPGAGPGSSASSSHGAVRPSSTATDLQRAVRWSSVRRPPWARFQFRRGPWLETILRLGQSAGIVQVRIDRLVAAFGRSPGGWSCRRRSRRRWRSGPCRRHGARSARVTVFQFAGRSTVSIRPQGVVVQVVTTPGAHDQAVNGHETWQTKPT